jgi:putative tricarboxylic transport membrane protein
MPPTAMGGTMIIRMIPKLATVVGIALAALGGVPAEAAYPERPITLIVPWGAGGGTDATGRILANMMEKELGVPVSVVNRTGGSGVVGHSAIATAAPDGYTLGVVTVEIGMMHWQGLTDLTYEDYTPLALYNADAAGLQVRSDSEWQTAQDVLDAAKANPGEHKASGTGQGGIWHLALAGMLQEAGIAPDAAPWVPSQGAAPGLQDLVAGGVDIVTCSVPEAQALLEAGRVKSLAVMSEERNPAFPDVPTLKEATGLDWTVAAWRGIAGPEGLPPEVVDTLVPLLQQIWESQEFRDFMAERGFGVVWRDPEGFRQWMAESDESLGAVMKAVGLAN